jgi:hypothetical protein
MDFILWQLPFTAGMQLLDVWNSRAGAQLVWRANIDKLLNDAEANH